MTRRVTTHPKALPGQGATRYIDAIYLKGVHIEIQEERAIHWNCGAKQGAPAEPIAPGKTIP